MAARLPVVITEGCEFPEVSEHGAGFVVEADEAPIVKAITMLLSDADLRKRMGQQGRKLVTERYTWQATAATMANLYKTLVAGDVLSWGDGKLSRLVGSYPSTLSSALFSLLLVVVLVRMLTPVDLSHIN